MEIGIGLPNPIPGTSGRTLLDWARRAEERGFASLATIDRVAYPSFESLIALAGAAAVTQRIELLTNVLLAPTRDPVLLAKEAASVDQLSGGRLTLGLGVGGREDDFTTSSRSFSDRGKRFDRQLELMHEAWKGSGVEGSPKPVTPKPVRDSIPVLIGGNSEGTLARVRKWGIGWTAGGSTPDQVASFSEQVHKAWEQAGRSGKPRIVALTYFALGAEAVRGRDYIMDYYGFLGDFAKQFAEGFPQTDDAVRGTAKMFEEAGVDEVIFDPTIAELDQIDLLAESVLG